MEDGDGGCGVEMRPFVCRGMGGGGHVNTRESGHWKNS